MNREVFLKILSKELKGIPAGEREDILAEYIEHFEAGIKRGRTEKDIADTIGDPVIIGRELKASTLINIAEKDTTVLNIFRAVFSTMGMGVFNLIFILIPFLIVIAVLIILFAAAISIAALGVVVLVAIIFGPLVSDYIVLGMKVAPGIFISVGSIALGTLFCIGNMRLVRFLYRQVIRYIRFNMKVFIDRRHRDEA
jgi:uncharacterized membrane protein